VKIIAAVKLVQIVGYLKNIFKKYTFLINDFYREKKSKHRKKK